MTVLVLKDKVGNKKKGAVNNAEDLKAIQGALSLIAKLAKKPAYDPTGGAGSQKQSEEGTVQAIMAFQKTFMLKPDGIVSPNLRTHKNINKTINALQCAASKATSPSYLVVHSTAGKLSKSIIEGYTRKNFHGKAHAYIMDDGEIINVQKFENRGVYATKAEKNKCELIGSMIHIELNYKAGGAPSEKQYVALAQLYVKLAKSYGNLAIVSHREVDRGIKAGHSDPENFSFTKLYDLIKTKNKHSLEGTQKITQERSEMPAWATDSRIWPPRLSGKGR